MGGKKILTLQLEMPPHDIMMSEFHAGMVEW